MYVDIQSSIKGHSDNEQVAIRLAVGRQCGILTSMFDPVSVQIRSHSLCTAIMRNPVGGRLPSCWKVNIDLFN